MTADDDAREPSLSTLQAQALWWAKFSRDYGITTVLSGILLGVVLGFIPAPMFSGAKPIEIETRDANVRLETNQGVILLRLETISRQIFAMTATLDRVTCVLLLSESQKAKVKTRGEFDQLCAWLRSGGGLEPPPEDQK